MKAKILFSVMFFFCLVFMLGCGKDVDEPIPVDPPPTVFVPFKITTLNLNPKDSVVYNGKVFAEVISNSDSGFVEVNEKILYTFDGGLFSKTFPSFIKDTEIVFTFYKNDSIFREKRFIKVYDEIVSTTLNVIVDSTTIHYNGSVTFTISSNGSSINVNPDDLIGFNGIPGTFSTPPLTENVIYNITASGEGGEISTSVALTVLPLPTDTDYLCDHPQYPDSVWLRMDTVPSWDYKTEFEDLHYTWYNVFSIDGTFKSYNVIDNVCVGGGVWYFENQDYIFYGYGLKHILSLRQNEFVVEYTEYCSGCPNNMMHVKIKYTAYH